MKGRPKEAMYTREVNLFDVSRTHTQTKTRTSRMACTLDSAPAACAVAWSSRICARCARVRRQNDMHSICGTPHDGGNRSHTSSLPRSCRLNHAYLCILARTRTRAHPFSLRSREIHLDQVRRK